MTDEEYEKAKADKYNAMSGNLNEEDGYNCNLCKNKGLIQTAVYVKDGDYWSPSLRMCSCQKARKALRQIKESGLNDVLAEYTLDKYEVNDQWQKTIKEKAENFLKNPNGWFFVGGQSGCGKSHICTAICGKFLKRGIAVKYMRWRDEVTHLKSIITDSNAYREKIDEYKNIDVLYIDDLFKTGNGYDGKAQSPTSADIQIAFEILNYRYGKKDLITIISSERTTHEILRIDEAIAGRISEMAKKTGSCININADINKNYRMRDATEI